MGTSVLSKLQYGKETTGSAGGAVAADVMLLAGAHPPVSPDRVMTFMEDDAGVKSASVRAPRAFQYLVQDTLNFEHAYFQLLPFLFSLGVKGRVTSAVVSTGGSDSKWVFSPSMTLTNTPDTATLELGDDVDAYEVEYMMIQRLRLSGVISQDQSPSPLSIEVEYFGRQHTKTSFTTGLSLPANEEINAKLCKFYVDATSTGIGDTEKTGLLRAFDIDIINGFHPKFHGGTGVVFDTHGEGDYLIVTTLTLEGNTDADAIFDAWKLGTANFLQFNISGGQIGTGVNHNLVLGVAGHWEAVTPIAEQVNGNNLTQAIHRSTYDATGARILQLEVITDVAAI
jgi:hypothetical protein